MRVSPARIKLRMEQINQIGRSAAGGWTRLAFSPEDFQARQLVMAMMEELGLLVTVDPAGNIIGRLEAGADGPVVATGSHLDTVVNGGMFDGVAGVVAALEAVETIKERGYKLRCPVEVIVFSDEEGVRFHAGLLGSRAIAGRVDPVELEQKRDAGGVSLADAFVQMGLDPQQIGKARAMPGKYKSFFELHIEQGGVLEENGNSIGVVEAIKGIYWLRGTYRGQGDHAGATPMSLRKDALLAVSELHCRLEKMAQDIGDPFVVTMGQLGIQPNAINTIPAQANFSLDIRDIREDRWLKAINSILVEGQRIAEKRGLVFEAEELKKEAPFKFAEETISFLARICQDLKVPYQIMPSGAVHDALIMGEITEAGMIFVPSRKGYSHCPEEWTPYEDLALGTEVLLEALMRSADTL